MFVLIEGTVPSKTSRTHEITLDRESLATPIKPARNLTHTLQKPLGCVLLALFPLKMFSECFILNELPKSHFILWFSGDSEAVLVQGFGSSSHSRWLRKCGFILASFLTTVLGLGSYVGSLPVMLWKWLHSSFTLLRPPDIREWGGGEGGSGVGGGWCYDTRWQSSHLGK